MTTRPIATALSEGQRDIRLRLEQELARSPELGGVAFGDGIESDALELSWGARLLIRRARRRLHLVV